MQSKWTALRFSQNKTASKNLYDQLRVNTNGTTTGPKPTSKPFQSITLFKSDSGAINWGGWIAALFLFIVIYYTFQIKNNYNIDAVTVNSASVKYKKEKHISPYIGNQLDNGSSPLTDCFGLGHYDGDLNLTIKNRSNSDAIVCLYSTSLERTIRNEYIQKKTSFTMANIAQGYYKIRVVYGNDWNPNLKNNCGSRGNFESDINFSEYNSNKYFGESSEGYSHASITLYSDANDSKLTSKINQSSFFKK